VQRVAHTPPDLYKPRFHPTNAPAHTHTFSHPMREDSKNKVDPLHVCAALFAVLTACMSSFRNMHCNDAGW
jgi:hypothetical protein